MSLHVHSGGEWGGRLWGARDGSLTLRILTLGSSPQKNPPRKTARKFYGDILQCEEGRSSQTWIDYSLFGHQIVRGGGEGPRTVLISISLRGKCSVPVLPLSSSTPHHTHTHEVQALGGPSEMAQLPR
jgi:hypothetical protein